LEPLRDKSVPGETPTMAEKKKGEVPRASSMRGIHDDLVRLMARAFKESHDERNRAKHVPR
jgi:hypothetical protein